MIELGIASGPAHRPEQRSQDAVADALFRLYAGGPAGTPEVASVAAVETAAGLLSRVFASAEVVAPPPIRSIISPEFLGTVGRNLVRLGQSLHLIDMDRRGRIQLLEPTDWTFEGQGRSPDTWRVRSTLTGPSGMVSRVRPYDSHIFITWGATPGQPWSGRGPLAWAGTSAKMSAEVQRALGDEASGPVGNLLPVPTDGGDGADSDPLKQLKSDIKTSRGQAFLVETTSSGWGEGRPSAPMRDWVAARLGANPPSSMVELAKNSFIEMLSCCGVPAALAVDSDGTAQRESFRRFVAVTCQPLAHVLATELSAKLETEVSFSFSSLFASDLAGRARAFQSLVGGGMDLAKAAGLAGLMESEA